MSEQAVTIQERIREALQSAAPHGLSMAAIAGVVRGPWRASDVEAMVRKLWELNHLGRRPDGTFGLTERTPAKDAGSPTRRRRSKMDAAVARVAAKGRREGHDSRIRERTVDPGLLRAYCARCRKTVAPRLDGTCAGCGTQTGANLEAPPKPRRRRRRRPLREGQAGFGTVCRCGQPKTKQAHSCRRCSQKRRTGRQLGPRPTRQGPRNMSEEQLLECRRLYATGLSLRQVCAQLFPVTSYASEHAMHESLYSLFRVRGWKLRPQRDVTRARNFKHGRKARGRTLEQERSYRRWLMAQRGWTSIHGPGRPICNGVIAHPPGKGRPCTHRAMEGSEFCWSHDPNTKLERHAQAARMRSRISRAPMLPAAPFAGWLERLYAQHGTWKAVGARIGVDGSMAHRYAKAERISVRVVRRSAEAAGTTLEAIYGQPAAESIAA